MVSAFLAIGTFGAVLWWLGLAIVVLVVIPAVVLVAATLIRTITEIHRYAEDIRQDSSAVSARAGEAAALSDTPAFAAEVGSRLQRYAETLPRARNRS